MPTSVTILRGRRRDRDGRDLSGHVRRLRPPRHRWHPSGAAHARGGRAGHEGARRVLGGSEYRGHYGQSDAALRDFHRPRLAVLVQSGADGFACRDGTHTCEGQSIADCARRLDGCAQIVALGVNCTAPEHVASLLRNLRAQTTKPLAAYPNSGEHYDPHEKRWSGTQASRGFATAAMQWRQAGARLIGGCCRTTPDDIRAIRTGLNAAQA